MVYVATAYIKNGDIFQKLDSDKYQLVYRIDTEKEKRNERILGCFMALSGEYYDMSKEDMNNLLASLHAIQFEFNFMSMACDLNQSDAEDLEVIANYVGQCVQLLQRLTDEGIIQDVVIMVTQEG